MSFVVAVLDACVLYPAPLRDLFMHLQISGLFQAKWSDAIHDEWIRNVLRNRPDLTSKQLARTRMLMNAHTLDCLTTGYEPWIDKITLPDPQDRHVLALAIHTKANVIITYNLKDFPSATLQEYKIRPLHPDSFIMDLFLQHPTEAFTSAQRHRLSLKHPPKTADEYLHIIGQQKLPSLQQHLRNHSYRL